MILLEQDCLLFQTRTGECLPLSVHAVTLEIVGDTFEPFDPEILQHVSSAVMHFFKHDQGRYQVTIAEFTAALEKVFRALGLPVQDSALTATLETVSDLQRFVGPAGEAIELAVFPRLRAELRLLLRDAPAVVRFQGLRACVKQLRGNRRWNRRCQELSDQIVDYLRRCLQAEPHTDGCALVVQ